MRLALRWLGRHEPSFQVVVPLTDSKRHVFCSVSRAHVHLWHVAAPHRTAPPLSSVNFFSFMVTKLVLAQVQFVAVLIVASVVLLPFISGAALLLWWDQPQLVGDKKTCDRPQARAVDNT